MEINSYSRASLKLKLLFVLFLNLNSFGQNRTETLTESWLNSVWVNEFKGNNTYDTNGYLTYSINQDWIPNSSSWKNTAQYFYTNNSDGNPNIELVQFWDNTNTWIDSHRISYTYTSSKKTFTSLTEIPNGPNWLPFYREENSYDNSTDYLIKNLSQYWNSISSSWVNNSQYFYSNNPNGKVFEILNQTWDIPSSQWNNEERITQTFNSNEKINTATIEYWVNAAWENNAFISYTYDTNGLETSILFQNWDMQSASWVNNTLYLYNYNGNSEITQITAQVWNTPDSGWNNWLRFNYTYSSLAKTTFDASTEFLIYPNPSSNQIKIKNKTSRQNPLYQISDQSGRLLFKGHLENEITPLDISPLPSGIYYFQTDKTKTIKIIKN